MVAGRRRGVTARRVPVSKALAAVSDMVDAGHVVVFAERGSCAYHVDSKAVTPFRRRNGVFEFDMQVEDYEANAAPFGRQVRP